MPGAVTAYLGLGSNMGDRQGHLESALRTLDDHEQVSLVRSSRIYETEPWGFSDQALFLNCAAEIVTTLAPGQLLELVKDLEGKQGRVEGFRYGPRPIDVDILLMGELDINWETPDLQIPHARMSERAFVLVPLAELASEVLHPKSRMTIGEMERVVEGKEGVSLWADRGRRERL